MGRPKKAANGAAPKKRGRPKKEAAPAAPKEPKVLKEEKNTGHNRRPSKAEMASFAQRYNNILDDLDSKRGEYMADAKELISEAADKLGMKKKVIRTVLKDQRDELKREAKESEWEKEDQDDAEILRIQLGLFGEDTELGQAAIRNAEKKISAPKSEAAEVRSIDNFIDNEAR